ncbi:ovalbumin-related protein Y [Toxorhynchites rutilus septentrionalis]|uniref:ovalbumin-related protein Y n=1 Tax=Toxorhynchites rutilus septentrionalis TaxID=329112 RepID=UPI002478B2D6|nr:ovalbumin-related protein Y [Toxorhynchites rutilus septentrionalis]
MRVLAAYLLLAIFVCTINALPKRRFSRDDATDRNLVGLSTNIIAASLLKGSVDSNANHVFSPIGFSSILAILSEGAKGQTLQEFYDVLKFPQDSIEVRSAFQQSLKRLGSQNPANEPQLKTWFYVYVNNTIDDKFKDILVNNYFVDVRDIERNDYNFDEPKTSVGPIEQTIEFSELPAAINQIIPSNNNSKDIIDFEELKIKSLAEDLDSIRSEVGITTMYDEVDEDENPKFDKNIDDKEYVEPTKIKEQIALQKDEYTNEVLDEPVVKSVAEDRVDRVVVDEPERVSLSLKKLDDDEHEIMYAVESQVSRRRFNVRRSFLSGDVASALSGNSLVGRKAGAKAGDQDSSESKMLLFNGLYYRGSWASPFQIMSGEGKFYVNGEEQRVTMMRAVGKFGVGSSQELDAKIVELPYNNTRYSLLIMVPNKPHGLKDLINNFNCHSLSSAQQRLAQTQMSISLPKFQIDTTSRAEKALTKLGLITVFTSKADLSGITDEPKIHVDELVQHVSIRVDEGASSELALSATNTVEAKTASDQEDMEEFVVNRPFVFFVRDTINDIAVVAGKVTDIPALEE